MAHMPCLDDALRIRTRIGLTVTGAVQGVGFRPVVFRLAHEKGLAGWVCNTSEGVSLELEGDGRAIADFVARLQAEISYPARIDRLAKTELRPTGEAGFVILKSEASDRSTAVILPDLATCDACREEIFDTANHRYRYPFTTCTHCGPRFSVVEAMPYDRCRTSMRHFGMCAICRSEYENPNSRRFHAETIACAQCGPQLSLCAPDGARICKGHGALISAARGLRDGKIVALKALGGFQLLVDARNRTAVARMRQRKHRPAKPFAVMTGSLTQAHTIAKLCGEEARLLESSAAPIVVVTSRDNMVNAVAENVAPSNPKIGLMLPATPLHHLLMAELDFPIVTTSGNRSGEPLAADDEEAFDQLAGIADLFITHDRQIVQPVDDSVARVIAGVPSVLRSARGYAPLVLADPAQTTQNMAVGGHMKNAVAIAGEGRIVLGPHIGDLQSAGTRARFSLSGERLAQLYGTKPSRISCDLHPDYYSTRFAQETGLAVEKVQHHFAHVLSVIVDNELEGPVLGVAWDGTGYGSDGAIWGGEFLLIDENRHFRAAHLFPFALPGGEAAMREPRRSALGVLYACHGDELWAMEECHALNAFSTEQRQALAVMLAHKFNSPLTSSAGRLFDAVAATLGLCQRTSFEGEAAMAVEFAADRAGWSVDLPPAILAEVENDVIMDWRPMLIALNDASRGGIGAHALARGFHEWLARTIVGIAERAGVEQVALTGGCFQNALLAELATEHLLAAGFSPFRHRRVPANDGGLAVGQAAFAARFSKQEAG